MHKKHHRLYEPAENFLDLSCFLFHFYYLYSNLVIRIFQLVGFKIIHDYIRFMAKGVGNYEHMVIYPHTSATIDIIFYIYILLDIVE